MNWFQDLNEKIEKHELSTFDAFVFVMQKIKWDENLIYISKKIRFIQANLGLLRLSLFPDLDWNTLAPNEKIIFINNRLFQEKKIVDLLNANPLMMGLMIQTIANINGIKLTFCLLGSVLTLKLVDKSSNYFFHLEKKGELISSQKILDLIFEGKQIVQLSFKELVIYYYLEQESYLLETLTNEELLKMYNIMNLIKEHDPQLIIKRVTYMKILGKNDEALSALKSYLNFLPQSHFTGPLAKLYKQLSNSF